MVLIGERDGCEPVEKTLSAAVEGNDKKDLLNKAALLSPQRKISRFLVSPVLSGQLNLPKGKASEMETKNQDPLAGNIKYANDCISLKQQAHLRYL